MVTTQSFGQPLQPLQAAGDSDCDGSARTVTHLSGCWLRLVTMRAATTTTIVNMLLQPAGVNRFRYASWPRVATMRAL